MLLLEEAAPVRARLLDILHKLGVQDEEMAFATDAGEALSWFQPGQQPPGVVFAELLGVHPEEGLEIVHEMLDRAPKTKIVLVTAEPRESPEVRAALRAGIFAYVEKPIRFEKIRAVLVDLASEEGGVERLR